MTRQRGTAQQFIPSRGFATEFTPTRFPTDAAVDLSNVVIDLDGSTRRRPGINFEVGYSLNTVNGSTVTSAEKAELGHSVALWKAVGNSGTLNIVVVQYGDVLQFYAQVGNVSGNLLGEVILTAHATSAGDLRRNSLAFASGIGNLYVVGEHLAPLEITYDGTNFTVTKLSFEQRDLEGLDDGLENDERPFSITSKHLYNLFNQGWGERFIADFAGLPTDTDVCGGATTTGGLNAAAGLDWPSNADIVFTGITADGAGNPVFSRSFLVGNNYTGNTPAPKGHFILDAFNKDYDAVSGCAGIGSEVISTRPIALAFHNGKLFYASPATIGKASGIFFSQTLTVKTRAGNMYQEADPTAQDINDLVATDGGFIPTPGIGEVYKLEEFGNGVVVGASNGIWFLSGADIDSGFSATSHRLTKISDAGLLGASSYIEADDTAFYFSSEGIMGIGIAQGNVPAVTNLSETTIQTFYINIAADARRQATGVYLPEQRKVYWGYADNAATAASGTSNVIDSLLVFDLSIKGFYKHTVSTNTAGDYPEVIGFTEVSSLADTVQEETVTTVSGETVFLADGVTPVTVIVDTKASQVTQLKMLTIVKSVALGDWALTFSELNDRTFHDWREFDSTGTGINYSSFIEFGYNTFGTNHTKGTPTYVHSFFSKTSKNLDPGGYYELPPTFTVTEGLSNSQSVLEVLHKANPDLAVSQSVVEVLLTANPALLASQSVLEVLNGV